MTDNRAENEKRASEIAREIVLLSRSTLLVNFRFLDRALSALETTENDSVFLACDGESLYFNPWFVLHRYKSEASGVTRDILHSVLHCVFCHGFTGPGIDRDRWNLACDMAVENVLNGLSSPCVHSARASAQQASLSLLESEIGTLTAEKIYRYLREKEIPEDELEKERENFRGDSHSLWYGDRDKDAKFDRNIKLKKIWEDVSKRMQTEMETMLKDRDSALIQNLKSLNRAKYSYTDFLRRFGVHGEVLRLSDEEFDNNYYTYGLELYGNIPLIEPLEYSDEKRIREFVIAIDTSGSVKGDVVQSFIQHTHDILMQQESFFSKINLHIIQCDHVIREDALIRSREEFAEYIKHMELKGFETTDFRPVFTYVDSLIESRELLNLQGLLYFTDGMGIFPPSKPQYDTAFVINRGDFNEPDIPVWAQRITLSEEDILDRRFSAV